MTAGSQIAVSSALSIDRLQRDDVQAARDFQRALGVNLALNASWSSFATVVSAAIWRRNR